MVSSFQGWVCAVESILVAFLKCPQLSYRCVFNSGFKLERFHCNESFIHQFRVVHCLYYQIYTSSYLVQFYLVVCSRCNLQPIRSRISFFQIFTVECYVYNHSVTLWAFLHIQVYPIFPFYLIYMLVHTDGQDISKSIAYEQLCVVNHTNCSKIIISCKITCYTVDREILVIKNWRRSPITTKI